MAPFEALYGRRCISPIGWFEVGEDKMLGPNFVHQTMEKVNVIQDRLKAAQSHQKSYVDVRRRELEFNVGDWVFLKVSPIKGVMQVGKKGKLSTRYIGPYLVVKRVGRASYKLELPSSLSSIHPMFHALMLRKYVGDPSMIVPLEEVGISDSLSYEVSIEILDQQVCWLWIKDVASVKVLWKNQKVEEANCDTEVDMNSKYPFLFLILDYRA